MPNDTAKINFPIFDVKSMFFYKMVSCKIDNETQSPELDEQIVAVFKTFKNWKAGTIHGKAIDTMVLYSFKIKDGRISL